MCLFGIVKVALGTIYPIAVGRPLCSAWEMWPDVEQYDPPISIHGPEVNLALLSPVASSLRLAKGASPYSMRDGGLARVNTNRLQSRTYCA